jgi:hypothetical protein
VFRPDHETEGAGLVIRKTITPNGAVYSVNGLNRRRMNIIE